MYEKRPITITLPDGTTKEVGHGDGDIHLAFRKLRQGPGIGKGQFGPWEYWGATSQKHLGPTKRSWKREGEIVQVYPVPKPRPAKVKVP